MDEILAAFTEDAHDLIEAMESGLLALEEGDCDPDTLNAVFRAAHTIKGDAGIVDLVHIEKFAHVLENYLDQLRNGALQVSRPLVTLLLGGCDHIKALFADVVAGRMEPGSDLIDAGAALSAALRTLVDGTPAAVAPTSPQNAPAATAAATATDIPLSDCWHITVRFGADTFRNGMDPLDFLRFLGSKGEVVRTTTWIDRIPAADDMDPESCYLGFEIHLHSRAAKEEIEKVFDFVRDACELTVLPPGSRVGDYIQTIVDLPEEAMRLGEILVKSDALTRADLDRGLELLRAAEAAAPDTAVAPHLGQILVERQMVQPEIVEAAAVKQQQISARKAEEARQIRVQTEKLDQLIDLVGEMVVSSAAANLLAQKSRRSDLMEANSGLARLVERMREFSLQLRMVQIGETFNRFRRVVRDMARDMNRDIDLVIRGGETELDKSVVEKIGDPLMHLIRNALDHGIEPAARRAALGKPAAGRIELNAYHETGGIVIEVADDGAGLDKERIFAKALERGLVQADQVLSDQEIFDLIFVAGFSTAEKVTNISGRGVGMDVVRSNISALRGSVEVQTQPGLGSRFVIRLPLTMAIIDGFLVGVGRACYVIPLDMVVECMEFRGAASDSHYLNLRGEVLPFLRLRELFGADGTRPVRENVVVVKSGKAKAGIVVDALLGEFQTVIKPLATIFRHLRGVAGSTILGTGDVALILDVPALMTLANAGETRAAAPPSAAIQP